MRMVDGKSELCASIYDMILYSITLPLLKTGYAFSPWNTEPGLSRGEGTGSIARGCIIRRSDGHNLMIATALATKVSVAP